MTNDETSRAIAEVRAVRESEERKVRYREIVDLVDNYVSTLYTDDYLQMDSHQMQFLQGRMIDWLATWDERDIDVLLGRAPTVQEEKLHE